MQVSFTFDVEEHDRIEAASGLHCPSLLRAEYGRRMEACTRWLLDALAEANAQATFFFVGQIARTNPRLIRDTAAAGHEIACHSWKHQRIHRQSPKEFRANLRLAVRLLEQVGGTPVVGYRAPTFSLTRETAWAVDILAEEGMRYDSSVFPVRHDRYGVPDAPRLPFQLAGKTSSLLELPPATLGIGSYNLPAAGGGYFRLFPLAVMRAAVRQIQRSPSGVPVLYFHPWEFDPSQPRLPMGPLNRLRTYVGISGSRPRFQRLLAQFGSIRLIDVVEQFEGGSMPLPAFNLGSNTAEPARAFTRVLLRRAS